MAHNPPGQDAIASMHLHKVLAMPPALFESASRSSLGAAPEKAADFQSYPQAQKKLAASGFRRAGETKCTKKLTLLR
jgi:hypothetical protein